MDYFIRKTDVQISQRKLEGYLKLAEIIQWGRKIPIKFCERFFGIEFLDAQKYAFMKSWLTPYNLWCITRNGGKALALDTKIPTPTGFTTMRDIQVGDYILDEQGKSTKVIFTSDIFYNHDCYEIEFDDGEKIVADAEHLWYVKNKHSVRMVKEGRNKNRVKSHGKSSELYNNVDENGYIVIKTENMVDNYIRERNDGKGNEYSYQIPTPSPVEYSDKELKVHPYVLGVWLGDGNSRDLRVTSHNDDVDEMCRNIEECGHTAKVYKRNGNVKSIGIDINKKNEINQTREIFRDMDLLSNKHIPKDYLFSSVEQRFELLKGLMDTDGSCDSKKRNCEFAQKDYNLIKQVSQLLTSLGIKHKISKRNTTCSGKSYESYRITFSVDKKNSCFKLKRKHNLLPDELSNRQITKTIISIKKVDSVPTKCIGVDNPMHLFLCGERNTITHNSTLSAPFIMAKGILVNGHNSYILSNVSAQSQDTFMKIEKIAKKEIASFSGLTDFFLGELVKSVANTDGFTHSQSGFNYKLYNGSSVTSLSGDINNNRGKRSNLNIYDESGWTEEEYVVATIPFLLQNSSFRLGGDIDVSTFPKQIPNQRLFISSASSTDSYFYTLYKDYAKRMFMGDKNYFVCDLNCEIMINATLNGKLYPVSLINRDEIEAEMRKNKEKALREFYNKFTVDGGDNQVFKRATIIRNSVTRLPVLKNTEHKKRRFVIAYDPAHQYDNSVCLIGEIIEDEVVGERMEICNGVSFVDIGKKKKTPMRTPEQIELLKQMILDYNGKGKADYENIECLLIDSGAGGHGTTIADYLMEDWTDFNGNTHKGFIDKEECKEYISKFPNAVDKLKLMSPQKYKKDMFDALLEMVNLDLISFTSEYDGKGFIMLPKETGKEIDCEYEDENGKIASRKEKEISYKQHKLDFEEELALKNIDFAKEELVNIYRLKGTNGNYKYDLPPDKQKTLNDDRAYCLALLGWYLHQSRRKNITSERDFYDPNEPLVFY